MCLWHNQFAVNYIKNTFQASAGYEMVSLLVFPEAGEAPAPRGGRVKKILAGLRARITGSKADLLP